MLTKRNWFLFIAFIAIIGFMNLQIYQKNSIKNDGETIYFKLAPVDPRAFMLGDYMTLNYEFNLFNKTSERTQTYIVTFDQQKIVIDAEPYNNETLLPNQRLFTTQDRLRPDRFYFQEGLADKYDQAKYGQFSYVSQNKFLLTELADENLKLISPVKEK